MFAVPVHQRRRSGQISHQRTTEQRRLGSSPYRRPTDVSSPPARSRKRVHPRRYFTQKFPLESRIDEVYLIDFETLTKTEGARQEAHWANSDHGS